MNYKYDLVAVLLPEDKWHNEKTIYSESFKTKMDTVKMFWTISNAISTKERNHDYFESDQAEIVLNKDYDKMFKEFVKKHSNKDYDEMDSAECDDILFKFDNYYDDLINNKIAKLTLEETIEICNKLAEQRNMKIEFRVELYIQDSNALDDFETLYYCTDDLDLEPYNNSIPYDIFYNFYHYEKTGYIANHFPILDNYN